MKRICLLADGASIHTRRWCAHFSGRGFEMHVITFRGAEVPGATVHALDAGEIMSRGGNWQVLAKLPAVRRLVRSIRPDLLHAQYATSYGLLGALCGFHPFVVTALGSDVLVSPRESRVYRMVLRYVFRKADWITSMADHMTVGIVELCHRPDKVTTVAFGIDPRIFHADGRRVPIDRIVIASTRNFEPVYDVQSLVRAFPRVLQALPRAELHLVGTGAQRAEIEGLVAREGVAGRVTMHGALPQPRIAELLRGTHVFVTTSLSDGNNISLNEAMACGCLSVATDIPANRQWVAEGLNGFFSPPGNPVALADRIVEACRRHDELQAGCLRYNTRLIEERATWSRNMQIVEQRYLELTGA
jgi:glycosyltransferase involved in cell wall biosynthesis